MIESTGIVNKELLEKVFPSMDRINKGPVAVIECFQQIPCNPCYTSCRLNAISELTDINNIPILDNLKCTGCGICISKCPGLSIMVIDGSLNEDEILFKIPYEFLPLPKVGEVVKGLNRSGEYICNAKVVKVVDSNSLDKTPVIHVLVNREYIYEFRNIDVEEK